MHEHQTIDRHVGERIRRRRAELGMTQHDVATLMGISYQQIQKYETGANRISAGRLYEMSLHLGVKVGYFFDGLDADNEPQELAHGGTNRSTIDLARNFGRLDNATIRSAVSMLVRALAEEQNPEGGDASLSDDADSDGVPRGIDHIPAGKPDMSAAAGSYHINDAAD